MPAPLVGDPPLARGVHLLARAAFASRVQLTTLRWRSDAVLPPPLRHTPGRLLGWLGVPNSIVLRVCPSLTSEKDSRKFVGNHWRQLGVRVTNHGFSAREQLLIEVFVVNCPPRTQEANRRISSFVF